MPPRHPVPAEHRTRRSARWWPLAAALYAATSCSDVRVVAVDLATIELEPASASILIGDSVHLEATLLDGSGNRLSGRAVAWSSSDPHGVPVDADGLVHGLVAGEAIITAVSGDRQASAEVVVSRPAPTLAGVQPASGQRLETLDVVLTGSGFEAGVTTVDAGDGITIQAVDVTGPQALTARITILGNAALGARDLSVTSPAPGGGTAVLQGGFTVLAEHPTPTLSALSPASGQRLETLAVTFSGTGFVQGLTKVDFGDGITVDDVAVPNAGSLTATVRIAGNAALGPRQVTVSNAAPGGGTATGAFTVNDANPQPALTGANPSAGQRLTSMEVALTGSGFVAGMTSVTFGPGIDVTDVAVGGPTTLTASIAIKAGASLGPRDIVATNPGPGGGTATLRDGFTVLPEHPAPTLDSVSPDAVQRRDTRDVTLTGSGFLQDVTTVSFGPDITVNEIQVTDPTSLIANIRIHSGAALGSRDLSVSNPGPGGGVATLTDGFMVLEENPAPTASEAFPEIGLRGTTLNVVLLGSGFVQGLTTVSFGSDITVNSVNVVFWTSLSVNITIAPDTQPGWRDVSVTNAPPGGGTFIMHDAFRVLPGGGG